MTVRRERGNCDSCCGAAWPQAGARPWLSAPRARHRRGAGNETDVTAPQLFSSRENTAKTTLRVPCLPTFYLLHRPLPACERACERAAPFFASSRFPVRHSQCNCKYIAFNHSGVVLNKVPSDRSRTQQKNRITSRCLAYLFQYCWTAHTHGTFEHYLLGT